MRKSGDAIIDKTNGLTDRCAHGTRGLSGRTERIRSVVAPRSPRAAPRSGPCPGQATARSDRSRGGKRQTVPKQGLLQVRRAAQRRCEDRGARAGRRASAGRAAPAASRAAARSPARDRRRSTGHGASRSSASRSSGIMGAGEHDVVGAPTVLSRRSRARFRAAISASSTGSPRMALLGDRREPRRADERDLAVGGVFAHERLRVVARHRPPRRQHADQPGTRGLRGRLDRGHHADERQVGIGRPQPRQRERRGSAAGHDHDVGRIAPGRRGPSRSGPARSARLRRAARRERPRRRRRRQSRHPASGAGSRRGPRGRRGRNRTRAPAAPAFAPVWPLLRGHANRSTFRLRSPARFRRGRPAIRQTGCRDGQRSKRD